MNVKENVIKGYELVMSKLDELEKLGYTVKKRSVTAIKDAETMAKYSGEDNLPFDLWTSVGIKIDAKHDMDKVFDLGGELYELGISFDTGFGGGQRDWEVDWSFRVSKEIK